MERKLADGVCFIEGVEDMFPDANVYVLGDPSTEDLTLVDAGIVENGARKLESMARLGLEITHIRRIIMTHTHLDHIGCVPEIIRRIPDVELWVHEVEAVSLERGDDRTLYGMSSMKDMIKSRFNFADDAFTGLSVQRRLLDGDSLELCGFTWEVIHIPGHSPGCIALYNSAGKILIPGDVIYADQAVGRFDLHGSDPEAHRASLHRLAGLEVEMLLPGHDRVMESVPGGYIEDTSRQWEPYIK